MLDDPVISGDVRRDDFACGRSLDDDEGEVDLDRLAGRSDDASSAGAGLEGELSETAAGGSEAAALASAPLVGSGAGGADGGRGKAAT